MKTKKSKRLLAAFLAAIMVLTTFAAMPFSSFAAEHTTEDLKNLLDQYESRVESGTPYTNLGNSYEAWYDGYVTYFLVTAGVRSADEVDTAYKNLETQFNAMQVWTPYKATANAAADGSYTSLGLVDGDQMSNVLYAYGVGETAPYADVRTDDGGAGTETRAGVQYGTTVLMYDGTGTPLAFPVSMYTARYTLLATSGTRSMRPVTSPFALVKNWHGLSNTPGYQTATESYVGYTDNSDFLSHTNADNGSPDRYSNTMYWTGDSSTFGNNYVLQYPTQDWLTYNEDRNSGTFTQTSDIYVINYKAIIDAVNAIPNDICDYSYSLTATYLRAIDKAMNIDPQSYIKGTDVAAEVNTLSSAISSAITGIGTAKRALTTKTNMDSYMQLASNYASYTPLVENGNKDGYYDAKSYTLFTRNYDIATAAINYIGNKTYRFTDVTSTNTNLVNAYKNLKAEGYVDDSELQTYFQQYYGLTKGYYTAETYDNLTEKINAALAYYNNGSYTSGITLKDTEEDAAIYNTILSDVKAAWVELRLSHDAVVTILGTQQSYNTAMAYAQGIDGYKYSNYTDVMDTVAEATHAMTNLDKTDFTDQATVIGEYTELITNIANALLELKTAFTGLADGTVINQTTGTTNGITGDNIKTYLSNQITNITYFKTVPGNSSYVTEYDISVNNHWYSWTQNRGAQLHSLGFGAFGQDTVDYGNGKMSVRWKEGGAVIEGASGTYSSYHDLLMKSTNSVSSGKDYVNIPAATDGVRVLGETTVTVGDLGINSATFTTPDLAEYFGVNAGGWDGFQTRSRTNTDVKQTVTVIDISDLIELVDQAADIVAKYQNNAFNCYTPETWAPFSDALAAAQADLNYTAMTASAITAEVQSRYNNLQSAMGDLQINTDTSAHNYIEQPGSQHATCNEAGKLSYVCSVCGREYSYVEDALDHDLTYTPNNDGATHKVTCSRGDVNEVQNCVDDNGDLYCDKCGQAMYTQADWTKFNEAKAGMEELLSAAEDGSLMFTSTALEMANINIAEIRYYNYTAEDQATVPDTLQDAVDQQTQRIIAATDALRNGITDESVYEANINKVNSLNADAYNIAEIKNAVQSINIEVPVEVNEKIYTGYDYDTYNFAITTAMSEQAYDYIVTVYDFNDTAWYLVKGEDNTFSYTQDKSQATTFTYGDYVTAPNPNTSNASEEVSWSFKSRPISKTDSAYNNMDPHFETMASEYSFNVTGDMEVYTSATAENNEENYKVTFVQYLDGVASGKIIYVCYAAAGEKVLAADFVPSYIPFYERVSASTTSGTNCNLVRGFTVKEDTTVNVYYESYGIDDYEVTFIGTDGSTISQQHYKYNEYVTLSDEGAVAYVNNDTGKVLCYGSEYSFYACQNVTVKAVTDIEQTASVDVISSPINDGNKIYLVGSFALPEGAKIKAYGFVLDGWNANHTGLNLSELDSSKYVINLYAYDYTCEGQNGNQFEISFNAGTAPNTTGTYVAYAIYTDSDGNDCYAYSNVITNAPIK